MSQKKPSWKDLKPIIEDLSSKEMLGLIRDLYNFCPENKEFFHVRFLVQGHLSNNHLKPYKDRIRIAVSPEEPWKYIQKLSGGRKAISDFKKVKGGLRGTLELMLYYVQCGNDFTLEFGDIDEPFYDSMEAMFSGIVKKLIQQKDSALTEEFMPKLEAELKRVDGEMGWGYPEALRGWMEELYKTFRPA